MVDGFVYFVACHKLAHDVLKCTKDRPIKKLYEVDNLAIDMAIASSMYYEKKATNIVEASVGAFLFLMLDEFYDIAVAITRSNNLDVKKCRFPSKPSQRVDMVIKKLLDDYEVSPSVYSAIDEIVARYWNMFVEMYFGFKSGYKNMRTQ